MIDRIIGKVKGIFNTITLIDMLLAFLCIVVGIIFFASTDVSNYVVSILTALLLISNGVITIFSYFKRGDISLFNNNLLYGIVLIIVGVLALVFRRTLSIILGIYLLIVGVQRVNYGLVFRRFKESSWLLNVVIGIMFIAFAIITFFANDDTIVKVAGIYLIGFGLVNLVNIILMRKRSEYFLN